MPLASKLYYFIHQTQEQIINRPPVILIHGAGGNYLSWPTQIRRMTGERIYALDLPGHGKSEGAGRQSIEEYVDDVISFMRELRLEEAVVVGISMGSAIALALALKFPKKVLGLGLLGAGSKLRVSTSIVEAAGNPNLFESAVEMITQSCFSRNTSASLLHRLQQQMLKLSPPVLFGDFQACHNFDVTSQLANIDLPTLIICGAEDKMTPLKYSERLRNGIANSQLHVVDNAGHMVMIEQPDLVAGLLKKFIGNIPARAA